MSVTLYDKALVDKFKRWTKDTNLHVYTPENARRLTEVLSDERRDKPIQLPILSIVRQPGYEIVNANKKTLSYDGHLLGATEEKSLTLNAVPINILYQIDIWTRYLSEADEYMRNLIFNIINYQDLIINIPYNNYIIPHRSNIRIITDVLDTSDNIPKLVADQCAKLSIGISIDDAYI